MTSLLPTTARALRLELARAQVAGQLPSLVAGVCRDGALAWCEGYGEVPGAPDDVQYRIGSITKTMTAVLVLQLVAGGRLALATPIGEVLPEVPYPDRTVADLLSHAAGVPAEPAGAWWERAGRSTEFAELVAAEAGRQPVLSAGTRFHYSNLAFALLGEAVARVRGTTWWEAVRTSLLAPLGMARTSWQPTGTAASGWSVHPHTGALLPEPHSDTGAMAPAGQLWSTVGDLARWGQFLLDGHPEVLSAEQLTAAYVPRSATFPRAMDAAHGLGFLVAARPGGGEGALVGHTGSMPGFLATCLVDRSHGTVAIALANGTSGLDTVDFGARLLEVLEEVEPSLPVPWRPSHPAPAAVAEVLGRWYWGAVPHDLNWEGRELVVRGPGGAASYRYRVDDTGIVGTHGYQDAEPLHVVRRADGSVSHLDLATFVLTRTPYDPAAPVPGGAPS